MRIPLEILVYNGFKNRCKKKARQPLYSNGIFIPKVDNFSRELHAQQIKRRHAILLKSRSKFLIATIHLSRIIPHNLGKIPVVIDLEQLFLTSPSEYD